MKKNILIFGLILLFGYFVLVVGLYYFQENIIFQSDKLDKDYTFSFDEPFFEVNIESSHSETINAILFKPEIDTPKGTVLYFHGNADNMQRWGNYAVDFTKLGYQVLIIDYTGFGKSLGTPTEEILYQNAEDTWNWAQHHLSSKNFIIYGRSLGTGVASYLATKHVAQQLILETPFYELIQDRLKWVFPFGLTYEFPNYKNISEISYPISIIQGTNDWVVSMKSAEKLKPLLKPTDQFFLIEKGSHKNLRTFEKYHKILEEIL